MRFLRWRFGVGPPDAFAAGGVGEGPPELPSESWGRSSRAALSGEDAPESVVRLSESGEYPPDPDSGVAEDPPDARLRFLGLRLRSVPGGGPRAFAAVREELVERRSCLTTSCLMGGLTRRIMLERGGLQGQLSLEPLWLLSSNQRRGQEYLSGSSSSRESMSGNVKRRKNSSTSATTVQQRWQ